MLRSVFRASRRLALAGAIISASASGMVASASDALPQGFAESASTGQEILLCGCGSVSCGGCETSRPLREVVTTQGDWGSGTRKTGGLLEDFSLGDCLKGDGCPPPWWAHRSGVFGEFLYLNAGSSDVIYALEGTDPDPSVSTPTGPAGIVNMQPEGGFRTGFTLAGSACSSLNATYSRWDGIESDSISATNFPATVLNSQLLHPSLDNAGVSSLASSATHKMNFQTFDLNYRHLWKRSDCTAVNWLVGLRYSNLEQSFSSQQDFQVANGLTDVNTQIDFEGFGLTGGLDFERYSCQTGLFIYGKGMASLLAGDWRANYRQDNQFGGGSAANRYEDFHATPILEGEIGLGWRSHSGRLRLQSGYMMAGWYEAVTTRGYIDAVRSSQLVDIGEAITFSGLTSRVTFAF